MTLEEREAAALEELTWELTAPHTYKEIGKRIGADAKTAASIEAKALAKLKGLLRVAGKGDWEGGTRDPDALQRAPGGFPSDGRTPTRGGRR